MSGAVPIFLPTFLTESGSSLWLAGISLTALEAAGVVGAFLSGTFSDWLGRRRIILISTVTPPIFLFLFLAVDGVGDCRCCCSWDSLCSRSRRC